MSEACSPCREGATGESGHAALKHYIMGPYPGHHIFQCTTCDERWIRHRGLTDRFSWTRYSEQFAMRKPRPIGARMPVTPS